MAERYFITVFGSQRDFGAIHRPKLAHTYATFTEEGGESEVRRELTISWLPKDGGINAVGRPEPGRNFSLAETIAWLDQNESTTRWASSKTEIQPRLFFSAADRVAELEKGNLEYVMVDKRLSRRHRASNCIHAVSDLAAAIETLGIARTGARHGNDASQFVYYYLWPFYVDPKSLSSQEQIQFDEVRRAQMAAGDEDKIEE